MEEHLIIFAVEGLEQVNLLMPIGIGWKATHRWDNVWAFSYDVGFYDISCPYGKVGSSVCFKYGESYSACEITKIEPGMLQDQAGAREPEFRKLWNSTQTEPSYLWKANPWVWVIEAKKI